MNTKEKTPQETAQEIFRQEALKKLQARGGADKVRIGGKVSRNFMNYSYDIQMTMMKILTMPDCYTITMEA